MARELLLVLFMVLCSVLFVETAVDIEKKKVMLRSVAQCKGQQSLSMLWYDFEAHHNDKTGSVSAKVKVKTKVEVSKDLSIMFNFWKCDASENPDSCEQIVKDFLVNDICTYMAAKDELWTPFMESFGTPIRCPIKPGVYVAKDIKVSPDFLSYMPVGDALWKVQMEGFDRGKKITCVQTVLQIMPLLVRRS